GPRRPSSRPPVWHRPGARSARREEPPSYRRPPTKGEPTMWFHKWLRKMMPITGSARTARRRPASCRLSVEALEERAVPTVSFQYGGNSYTGGYNTQSVATGDFNHD